MKDLIHYEDGVHAIDSGYGRPQLAAIHVIVQDGRAAVVDTASNASVPRILGALAALGIAPEAVDWVLLTHIHLDHAGGAGSLMCALPRAKLLVHPRGLRHMIDPSKLWEATCAVYGPERAFDLYGQLVPVPAERIVPATDGLEIQVGSRMLRVFDTPGHARHHICIWDSVARAFFTGDTFGLSYRELDVDGRAFVVPTTTPTQFDPEGMHTSIDRMLAMQPQPAPVAPVAPAPAVIRVATLTLESGAAAMTLAYDAGTGELYLAPTNEMAGDARVPHLWLVMPEGGVQLVGAIDGSSTSRHSLGQALSGPAGSANAVAVSMEAPGHTPAPNKPDGPVVAQGVFQRL